MFLKYSYKKGDTMSQEVKGGADLKLDAGFESTRKGDDHVVNTYKDPEAFANNLPEGVSKNAIKELKRYERNFSSAVLQAGVDQAIKDFKADKKVEIVENKFQTGLSSNDNTNVIVRRAVSVKVGFGADAKTNIVPQIKVKTKSSGTVGKTEVRRVQTELAEKLK